MKAYKEKTAKSFENLVSKVLNFLKPTFSKIIFTFILILLIGITSILLLINRCDINKTLSCQILNILIIFLALILKIITFIIHLTIKSLALNIWIALVLGCIIELIYFYVLSCLIARLLHEPFHKLGEIIKGFVKSFILEILKPRNIGLFFLFFVTMIFFYPGHTCIITTGIQSGYNCYSESIPSDIIQDFSYVKEFGLLSIPILLFEFYLSTIIEVFFMSFLYLFVLNKLAEHIINRYKNIKQKKILFFSLVIIVFIIFWIVLKLINIGLANMFPGMMFVD